MRAQPARATIKPATGPRRRRNAMPLRAESSLRRVVGDDVAGLEPGEMVYTTGPAGRGHGTRAAIVPGRPDHLVACGREQGARPVDVRLVEGRVNDRAFPFLARWIVVHEDHPVELAEVVDGND